MIQTIKIAFLGLTLSLFGLSGAWPQSYANPADRYLDAYKAYENAQCPIAADDISHFVYFARDRDAI
jgi:short subunit fatty acids transporter